MQAAADDFRLFWDNAYAVHHLTPGGPAQIAPMPDACERAGNADRAFVARLDVEDHVRRRRGRVLRIVVSS